ncbi:MAG: hypothetical protein JXB04_09555 [Kiritimatiellae bacterium]|nr:hypothetical protein [Kiritimatiellia bacterium]
MKISLNMGELSAGGDKEMEAQLLEKMVQGTRDGEFQARDALVQHFMPLLQSLAKKRGDDVTEVNRLIEVGKQGLLSAARKYKPGQGADKFRLLAVDLIDRAMSDATRGGFFARLFGKK